MHQMHLMLPAEATFLTLQLKNKIKIPAGAPKADERKAKEFLLTRLRWCLSGRSISTSSAHRWKNKVFSSDAAAVSLGANARVCARLIGSWSL